MSIHYYQRHKQHWKVNYKIKIFAWCLFALSTLLGLFSFWDYARYIPMRFGILIPIILLAALLMSLCKDG